MKAILVDDEPLTLQDLAYSLSPLGVNVIAKYSDPRQALEALSSRPDKADVVFLDINMPEMNGLELADRLGELAPHIHIVFVTAYDEHAVSAFRLNALDYILKPFDTERLQQTVKRIRRAGGEHADGTDNASTSRSARGSDAPAEPVPMLSVRMFGEVAIVGEAGEPAVTRWHSAKALELFCYLVHMRGEPVRRDVLQDLLWPDQSPEGAAANLYSTIYQLRRTLQRDAGGRMAIVSTSSSYVLERGSFTVDAEQWESEVKSLDAPNLSNWELHRSILASKPAPYLARYGYPWAEARRQQLASLWMHHALALAEFLLAANLVFDATTLLFDMLKRDEYSERARFGLMKAYAALGQPAAVTKQYEELTEFLAEEFSARPSEETTTWYRDWRDGRR